MSDDIKTKKCQPAAGDRPDLIQTMPVPSRGLTHPETKKSTEHKKYKLKNQNAATENCYLNTDEMGTGNRKKAAKTLENQTC